MSQSLRQLVSPFSALQRQLDWAHVDSSKQNSLGILALCHDRLPAAVKGQAEGEGADEQTVWREIWRTVSTSGGAMIRGFVDRKGATVEMEVAAPPLEGESPPAHFWLIKKSGEAVKRPLLSGSADCTTKLAWGEHLVLPLTEKDERRFKELLDLLGSFPSGERMAFFHGLGQPDLEVRIRLLEKALNMGTTRPREKEQSPTPATQPPALSRRVILLGAGMLLLLVAAVATAAFLLGARHAGQQPPPSLPLTDAHTQAPDDNTAQPGGHAASPGAANAASDHSKATRLDSGAQAAPPGGATTPPARQR